MAAGACVPAAASAADLQAVLDRAIRAGASDVRLPSGTHRTSAPLHVRAARGLRIDARGVRLIVTTPSAGALHIDRSTDVRVRGLTIDYDPLPFTQGRLVSADPGQRVYDIALDPGYTVTAAQFPGGVADLHPIAADALRPLDRGAFLAGGTVTAIGPSRARWIPPPQVAMEFYDLRPGDRVALGARWSICAVQLSDARRVRLDGVRIHAAPGCGVGETRGGGSRMRVAIRPGPPPGTGAPARLLSTNRDGIHSSGAAPGPRIHDSDLRSIGDDGINVENRLTPVRAVRGRRVVLADRIAPFGTGDKVVAYAPDTLRTTLTARVRAVDAAGVTLSRTGGLAPGHLLVAARYGGDAHVQRTTVVGSARCGVVVRGRGARIEDNQVIDAEVCGVWIGGELGAFREGDIPSAVLVARNRLTRIGVGRSTLGDFQPLIGAISVVMAGASGSAGYSAWNGARLVRDVRLIGNEVNGAALYGVFVSGARNVAVCGNTLLGVQAVGAPSAGGLFGLRPDAAIGVRDADGVRVSANRTDRALLQVDPLAGGVTAEEVPTCPRG